MRVLPVCLPPLVAVLLLLNGVVSHAQVVSVSVRFKNPDSQACSPRGCQVIPGSIVTNYGSGAILGKAKGGQSIILSCQHILNGPRGSKFLELTVDGVKAHLLRKGQGDEDLSLLWTSSTLPGKALHIADADPEPGQELAVWGYDPGKKDKPVARQARVKRQNVIGVAVKDGNSGGPVIGKNSTIYGVVWGYTKATRENPNPQESYFVPASRIQKFLNDPKPVQLSAFHETTEPSPSQFSTDCPPCPPCPTLPPYPTTGPVWPGFGPGYPTTGPVFPGLGTGLPDNSLPGDTPPIVTDNLTIISPNVNLVPSPGVPQPEPSQFGADPSIPFRLRLVEQQLRNVDGRVRRLESGNPFWVWRWNWWLRLSIAERRLNNLDGRVRALEYRGF